MTKVIFNGPQPPAQKDFCTVCLLWYKALVVQHNAEQISQWDNDGLKDATVVFEMRNREPAGIDKPQLAIGVGPVQGNPQFGLVRVCWTHALTMPTETPKGLAVANTGNVDQAAALAGGGLVPGLKGARG